MNYYDVKDIEHNRPPREGHSPSGEELDYVIDELQRLGDAIDKWLETHDDGDGKWRPDTSGIYNSGHCFANETFCLLAYDWSDGVDEEGWGPRNLNFYHFSSGADISWYKYWTRGTYIHDDNTANIVDQKKLGDIIDDCIRSLETTAINEWEYVKPGIGGY